MTVGKVFFVGAGPGDPKLITVRGMEAIARADVVVYDRLASPRLLRYMKKGAQKIYVGKLPDRHTLKQEEINSLLLELSLSGKVVTRLKGGDPAVFGRVAEEALTLVEQGVPFEMIPGVTSAIAVPTYAGIPVTHRGLTSSFAVVTGHECPRKDDSDLDWQKLATATGTLIFLMGVKNLDYLCQQMLAFGRSPHTPVAVIQWGTCTEQRTVTATIESIVQVVAEAGLHSPAITIVGEVVQLREQLNWFERKPLFGQQIVVTRARTQASELVVQLEELGAEALEFPVIETQSLLATEERRVLESTLSAVDQYDWLIFTSVNGVEYFFAELAAVGMDIRLVRARIIAIGSKTAAALQARGLQVEMVPESFQAEGIVPYFTTHAKSAHGARILLARAKAGRDILPRHLTELGYAVTDLALYETVIAEEQDDYVLHKLASGQVDMVTFTSSSTVTNFLQLLEQHQFQLPSTCKLVCLGPITAQTARAAGLSIAAVAEQATIEALVTTIVRLNQSAAEQLVVEGRENS